ncbi:MAG: UDP-N-acetylmuramoyl-L-alanyl-D-glutamate--2,6-diaminopimelate ligase [Solirubrobacteraceae bacterium]
MTLREVMGEGDPAVEVSGLAYDSRSVSPGTLFFCVSGFEQDGHAFAPAAIEAGASALVVERPLGLGVPEVVVASVRAAMAPAAARFHGDPTADLEVFGVTGTNGKTTTAFLLRALFQADGRQTGLMGTIASVVGGEQRPVARTTPEAIDLQRDFRAMADAGDRAVAMEVSSHALDLHRCDAIHWDAALFTNLTQDHLDFHPDMEAYFQAKRRLFLACPDSAIVNADDPYGRRLAEEFEAVTFALEGDADYRAKDVETGLQGSSFTVRLPGKQKAKVRSPLPGRFNVANILGAVAVADLFGIPKDTIEAAVADAARVPGRFEPLDEGQPFAVLVDYAHTPDGLENVLEAARGLGDGRVVCVFGCGGDRDRAKRPLMGEIAVRLADAVVVTSDNPRSEDPEAIIAEILTGTGAGVETVVDRREAIARAIELAAPGDVVVIAGKGHEQGQEFAHGRKEPFDDVAVAREALGRARPVTP